MKSAPVSFWNRIAWYVPIGAMLTLLPVLKYSQLWWELPREQKLALLFVSAVYGIACIATLWLEREDSWRAALRTAVRSLAVLAVPLVGIAVLDFDAPSYLLAPLLIALAVLIPLSASPLAHSRVPAIALGIAGIAVITLAVRAVLHSSTQEQAATRSNLRTAFYTLRATNFEGLVPRPATRGGGLDRLGDRVLLAAGDGALYLVELTADGPPNIETLATRVPNNREEFAAAFGGSATAPTRSSEYSEAGPPRVQTWRFRVADVIAKQDGENVSLFASHHWWKGEEECFVVRVSELSVHADRFAARVANAGWTTLYESMPCVPLTGPERKRGKNPFKGEEVGGRLAWLDDSTLLLTLGDQGFSGAESLQAFAQDPQADYGKTIRIDLETGVSSTFTMGHRNPQGLYVAPEGAIWLTEHGAQGGDEVNALVAGENYGWPFVTYGTDYGSSIWPVSRAQGRHTGFREPQFAWLPSIGVSQVIRIESAEQFPIWQGDLLVGSLSTRSLYRLVTDGERIVLSEPIALGKRVRDILELPDGRILVWTDDAALVVLEQAQGNDGETLFASHCSGCHAIEDGISHRLGPDLADIVGRDIGTAAGFDEYSAALRAQRGVWTKERLDAFLRDPQGTIPGNSMAFAGIQDAEDRALLVAYLSRPASNKREE
jgi:cytochrome c2